MDQREKKGKKKGSGDFKKLKIYLHSLLYFTTTLTKEITIKNFEKNLVIVHSSSSESDLNERKIF